MSDKTGLDDLVNAIVGSITMTRAIEQAVQKQIEAAMEAAQTVTTDLITKTVSSPDLAQENLKIQKAIIDKTIAAIHALGPTDKASPKSKT